MIFYIEELVFQVVRMALVRFIAFNVCYQCIEICIAGDNSIFVGLLSGFGREQPTAEIVACGYRNIFCPLGKGGDGCIFLNGLSAKNGAKVSIIVGNSEVWLPNGLDNIVNGFFTKTYRNGYSASSVSVGGVGYSADCTIIGLKICERIAL